MFAMGRGCAGRSLRGSSSLPPPRPPLAREGKAGRSPRLPRSPEGPTRRALPGARVARAREAAGARVGNRAPRAGGQFVEGGSPQRRARRTRCEPAATAARVRAGRSIRPDPCDNRLVALVELQPPPAPIPPSSPLSRLRTPPDHTHSDTRPTRPTQTRARAQARTHTHHGTTQVTVSPSQSSYGVRSGFGATWSKLLLWSQVRFWSDVV